MTGMEQLQPVYSHFASVLEKADDDPVIAVLIPCYNEEVTIAKVVSDFRSALPAALIYVYDNNSKDRTAELARDAGAIVRKETLQGKGNVMRRMFADIEADVYVLADGDDTYDAPSAPKLISELLQNHLDMVNGLRQTEAKEAYRLGHRFGNMLLTGTVRKLFGDRFLDMLSGYRVLSRRFVKSFPALATGFEIETELTIHALELRMPAAEIPTPYRGRPEGSASKLRTFHDGFRILRTIAVLVKRERPLSFFGGLCAVLVVSALILGAPVVETYFETGLVPRLPTAVLATGLVLLGFLSLTCGLILDTVTHGRRELKRLFYLQHRASGYSGR
ncbi:MAG: glycosyltransferase family 2 protein [Rhodomicrobium sp.]